MCAAHFLENFITVELILFLQLVGSLQAKKKVDRSSIIDVNDIKPFKKLQRTHTNLLVLFAQSGKRFHVCSESNCSD